MILVDLPYFNEFVPICVIPGTLLIELRPGFGTENFKNPNSAVYNKNIALQNVRWAMVEWMQEESRRGLWAV